jgi:hypothetical protein
MTAIAMPEPDRSTGTLRRHLLAMAALALGLRIALCALATAATGTGFSDYARAADGYQYLDYAHAWRGDMAELESHPLYRRLFPGYPALIAALSAAGVPEPAAALLPSWLAAPAVAVLAALVFGDRRIGWAMAALTPAYVFSGSLISTEALCLLLSLAGMLLAQRRAAAAAGLAFGLGGLFRPVAVFAMLGTAAREAVLGRRRAAAELVLVAGAAVAAGFAAVAWRFGDALMTARQSARAFGGEIFTWPFMSLVTTPVTTPVAAWKLAYVGVHAACVLAGCAWAVRQWRRAATVQERGMAALAACWLLGNTLYVLSIGNVWGFHDFPRFIVPALPALFWVSRAWLPRRPAVWAAIGLVCLGLSLAPAKRRLEQPPADSGIARP